MSDFEDRLGRALDAGAEDAPGVVGLAEGARSRARRRRRRTTAAAASFAVVAVALPVAMVAGGGWGRTDRAIEPPPAATPSSTEATGEATGGWHTVRYDGDPVNESGDGSVLIDVPADWELLDTSVCEYPVVRIGPENADPCEYQDSAALVGSATFDPNIGPGLRSTDEGGASGFVDAGRWAVLVASGDRDVVRRVLASARVPGEELPDLSGGWVTRAERGVSYELPASSARTSVVIRPAATKDWGGAAYARPLPDGGWQARLSTPDLAQVVVTAPTQALAELIASSAVDAG